MEHSLSFAHGASIALMMLVLYYGNERSILHRAFLEKIFWALMYGWLGFIFVCIPDSPLLRMSALGRDRQYVLNGTVVMFCSVFGYRLHISRVLGRLSSRTQEMDLSVLVDRENVETVTARIAICCIQELIALESSFSGHVQRLLFRIRDAVRGSMHRHNLQRELLEVLNDCCRESPPNDLLFVLNCSEVDLPQFLDLLGSQEVLDLLRGQCAEMDAVTKIRLVDALRRQPDFFVQRPQQELLVELVVSTQGKELSMMKDLMDEGGDFYNMYKLVFFDLPEDLSERALRHIREQGRQLAKLYGHSKGPLKILSDVDDTLCCSGGHFPAGCDDRFPKGQIYPGVLALFKELSISYQENANGASTTCEDNETRDRSLSIVSSMPPLLRKVPSLLLTYKPSVKNPLWLRVSQQQWKEISVEDSETLAQVKLRLRAARTEGQTSDALAGEGEVSFSPPQLRVMSNLVFLSARPHAYKDYIESKSYQLFTRLYRTGRLHCMPTLLTGRMRSSLGATLKGTLLRCRSWLPALLLLNVIALIAGIRMGYIWVTLFWAVAAAAPAYSSYELRKDRSLKPSEVWEDVGDDKVKTFLQYRELYQECSTVLFGDNGQGDLLCGEKLRLHHAPDTVSAVFIHQVAPFAEQLSSLHDLESSKQREKWKQLGVHFFRNYVGAAVAALHCGLLKAEGLSRVGKAAAEDMVRSGIRNKSDESQNKWLAVVKELNEDVEIANELLPTDLKISKIPESVGCRERRVTRTESAMGFSFSARGPSPSSSKHD